MCQNVLEKFVVQNELAAQFYIYYGYLNDSLKVVFVLIRYIVSAT